MSSYFPDVNVWIALAYRGHQHHEPAAEWFNALESDTAYFCRMTQLGFLRLLCHSSVMRDEMKTQYEAWRLYDRLLADANCAFHREPEASDDLENLLRTLTSARHASSKQWPDAYLAAFSQVAGLTLVTFDRALHKVTSHCSLLLS